MRIHTEAIGADLFKAARKAGVFFEVFEEKGSRKSTRAFEVRLSGSGRTTTGPQGNFQAATWDEWGVFFAALFESDPRAIAGRQYDGYYDFHNRTAGRFVDVEIPQDTHIQHRWDFIGGVMHCSKCTATFLHIR